jgi:hypothetical protein
MVLSPAQVVHPTDDEPAKRALAYEQAIARARHDEAEKAKAAKKADIPPFETVTSEPQADTASADSGTDQNAVQVLPPDEENPGSQDLASLPHESADAQDGADGRPSSQDMAALPDGQAQSYDGVPPLPGEEGAASNQYGTDGGEQWGDERDGPPQVDVYGRPRHGAFRRPPTATADPYGDQGSYGEQRPYGNQGAYGDQTAYGNQGAYGDQGDPYGPPQAGQGNGLNSPQYADQNSEEWVDVMVSGAPMRATASDDAPMLFAFPYGRNLRVVSRYEGWVEVADPKSGATGWMQAGVLAPSAVNRDPYGQNEAYYDDAPRRGRRGGWLQRNADEFSNMLNRAFGGGGY